ncbi:hypothetical protein Bbelb_016510 [Branchiostoma belcheri]|nr:hypothetical protein Bbelb_016510 [Branchiostoma belcheri]
MVRDVKKSGHWPDRTLLRKDLVVWKLCVPKTEGLPYYLSCNLNPCPGHQRYIAHTESTTQERPELEKTATQQENTLFILPRTTKESRAAMDMEPETVRQLQLLELYLLTTGSDVTGRHCSYLEVASYSYHYYTIGQILKSHTFLVNPEPNYDPQEHTEFITLSVQ